MTMEENVRFMKKWYENKVEMSKNEVQKCMNGIVIAAGRKPTKNCEFPVDFSSVKCDATLAKEELERMRIYYEVIRDLESILKAEEESEVE